MPELENNGKSEEMSVWVDKEGIVNIKMIRNLTSENVKILIKKGRSIKMVKEIINLIKNCGKSKK